MRFALVDAILEQQSDRIVTLKNVTLAEEYLGDHFPGFPVLPGVFMVEAMVQAARRILEARGERRFVLGGVKALRYGTFVRPGESLRIEVLFERRLPDGSVQFKGTGRRVKYGLAATAAEARSDSGSKATPAHGDGAAGTAPDGGSVTDSTAGGDTAVAGRFTMRPLRSGETAPKPPGAPGGPP
ncbi:MAG TPA: hypothetical protein PKC43_00345 [Phycisphaerales bacterium]|nr:hypothetical protein [Phycisphaerales bacterium]HMP35874.1 hypothetical protein [Phycisphaerales bacterium]